MQVVQNSSVLDLIRFCDSSKGALCFSLVPWILCDMATQVSSSSEDEGPVGGAGNMQISRKFSVADYSDLLTQSGSLVGQSGHAPSSSDLAFSP